jgi:hypothetical protein
MGRNTARYTGPPRHIHSERARDWLEKLPEEKIFFCRFTQLTVLRLLTSAAVKGGDVRKVSEDNPQRI